MKKLHSILMLVVVMSIQCLIVSAQEKRTLSGFIKDADGNPVPGVTITEKGAKNTKVAGANGEFNISVSPNATLVFTSIGYNQLEVKVGNQTVLQITLELTSGSQLGEVVVTALGVKREKRSLGYATSTVTGDDLVKAGATLNPVLAMYGKAAGVGINIGSGGPTASVRINIRGAAGLESNTNTRPLFVVDGVPLYDESTNMESRGYDPLNSFDYGSGINDINPGDIESIEILKGAKATVLYGSQALNGVVLITTKSGKKTRGLGMQFSQQITFDKPFTFIEFQNEYGSGSSVRDTQYATLNGSQVRRLPLSRLSFGPKFDGSQVMLYDSTMGPDKA
jgi:TonB-dependent SusC/RagA subfamily outer membrane receptor